MKLSTEKIILFLGMGFGHTQIESWFLKDVMFCT